MPDGPVPSPSSPPPSDLDEAGSHIISLFTDFLDNCLDEVTELAEQGVDPTPVLRALAAVMHRAADQLDPRPSPDNVQPRSSDPG